jgi:hypothetical protein
MTVPLPTVEDVLLGPPSAEETAGTARGVATAVAAGGRLTDLQRALLEALFRSMTGHAVDLGDFEPMDAHELALHLARRNLQFRTRGVQVMLLAGLILRPLPSEVVERMKEVAAELGVDEQMIAVARHFADGALGLAGVDFQRNGYTADWRPEDARFLHTSRQLQDAWDGAVQDADLAERWRSLESLPEGSLGRLVSQLYLARGFAYPGTPGSAPPLLAQHDWVHVLADYGTTVDNELEVFALIARANDDMRAFSLLAMVISLFETGYLRTGAGLFEYDPGHLSGNTGVVVRIADAMRRGALCHDSRTGSDSVDFLAVDWFELAHLPVDEVRRLFRLGPRSPEAVAAGSVGPWEPGGISPFQRRAGEAAADAAGRAYDPFGATVG